MRNLALTISKCLVCVFLSATLLTNAIAEDNSNSLAYANALSNAFANVATVITPSVVSISTFKKATPIVRGNSGRGLANDPFNDMLQEFFGQQFPTPFDRPQGRSQQGLGTGVIVSADGHILTNNHVVADADEVKVTLSDDKTYDAKIIGTDPRTDLAVLKIAGNNLNVATLGNSDTLKIGEWVVAAGSPFGLDKSITAGIVSAKGRTNVSRGSHTAGQSPYEDFIQTDAAINPGNSGGPLVNLKGEVVGINSAILSKTGGYMGVGFAIPINMARFVLKSLIKDGKVIRGWLGVGIQPLTEELAKSFSFSSTDGALVPQVTPDSPAEKGGIREGDIIIEFNDVKIKDPNQLRNMVAATKPKAVIDVKVMREGRKKSLRVKIGETPSDEDNESAFKVAESNSDFDLGISVEELTPEIARQLGTHRKHGVVVSDVEQDSMAAQAGIMPHDIIVAVNAAAIDSIADLRAQLTKKALRKGVRIVLETRGMKRFIFLKSR